MNVSTMRGRPFRVAADFEPAGESAAGDSGALRGLAGRARPPDPAGGYGERQDLLHGAGRRSGATPHHRSRAEQDPGRAALRRDAGVLSRQRGGVLRLVLYDYYQPEAYLPTTDTYIEKDASVNEHIEQMRLSATKALLERDDSLIVATVSSIYGLGEPETYHAMVLHLVRGDIVDQRFILRRLAELQYHRNEVELHRGTYRVRGEIIDIYPAESERDAVRVELFDDEIESLSFFDPLTGETVRRVPRLTIYPSSHYVTPRETILSAIDEIRQELVERLETLRSEDRLLEAQRLEQRTRFRHRNDAGARSLQGDRELLPLPSPGDSRGNPRPASSTISRLTPCSSSTRAM